MLRVAYVTTDDALDATNRFGKNYFMAKSLQENGCILEYIGPLVQKHPIVSKARNVLVKAGITGKFMSLREESVLKSFAMQVATKLEKNNVDIVFSPGSLPVAYLECKQPIVFWTDATFGGISDFYPDYTGLCKRTIKNGHKAEQAALDRCAAVIFKSEWAANTAINIYKTDPSKVKIVPNGANIDSEEDPEGIKRIIDIRPRDKCKLLFIGFDWERKGGDFSVKIAEELNKQGLKTELHIVGCSPRIEKSFIPNFIVSHGCIDKSTPDGLNRISKLLAEAHFLVLPAKAECFGIVFCEASAYGVPSLATKVGGITSAVKDDINGKTFSLDSDVSNWCTYILGLMNNYSQYKELAISSFKEYRDRLNWQKSGCAVKKVFEECLDNAILL